MEEKKEEQNHEIWIDSKPTCRTFQSSGTFLHLLSF